MTTQLEDLEIRDLIARYFRTLQDRDFSAGWGIRYFTDDVRVESPPRPATGQAAVEQAPPAGAQGGGRPGRGSGNARPPGGVAPPHGTATGQEAVKQSQQAVEQWAVIHYLNTDLIVDRPDPERVTATWSALMTHVPHVEDPEPGQNPSEAPIFTVGGVRVITLKTPDDLAGAANSQR